LPAAGEANFFWAAALVMQQEFDSIHPRAGEMHSRNPGFALDLHPDTMSIGLILSRVVCSGVMRNYFP
jgi:hypothetical protein